jgi:hypothetical protein
MPVHQHRRDPPPVKADVKANRLTLAFPPYNTEVVSMHLRSKCGSSQAAKACFPSEWGKVRPSYGLNSAARDLRG